MSEETPLPKVAGAAGDAMPTTLQGELASALQSVVEREKIPAVTKRLTAVVTRVFEGPIPPAEFVEDWQRLYPDAPREIFQMAVREQEHRHAESRRDFWYGMCGQLSGLLFVVAVLGCATWLAINGHDWVAGTIATPSIIGVVVHFIRGNKVFGSQPVAPAPTPRKKASTSTKRPARKRG